MILGPEASGLICCCHKGPTLFFSGVLFLGISKVYTFTCTLLQLHRDDSLNNCIVKACQGPWQLYEALSLCPLDSWLLWNLPSEFHP